MICEIESDDVACYGTLCTEYEDCRYLEQTLDNILAPWCDRLRDYLSLPSPHLDTRHIQSDLDSLLRVSVVSMISKDKTLCDFLLSKHLLSILKSSVTFHTFNYLFLKFIILFLKTMLFTCHKGKYFYSINNYIRQNYLWNQSIFIVL